MESKEKLFEFQLEVLKKEMDLTEAVIDRMDNITQSTKNWGIISWLAVVTAFLSQENLQNYVVLTGIIPLIFWFIDAWWLSLHRGVIVRQKKIRKYINGSGIKKDFDKKEIDGLELFDPYGTQYKGTDEYKKHTNVFKIMRFKEIQYLFGSLLLISIGLEFMAIFIMN